MIQNVREVRQILVPLAVLSAVAAGGLGVVDDGQIILAGGVAANRRLRERLVAVSSLPVVIPAPVLCTDNAAMIAACSYFHLMTRRSDGWDLDVQPNLKLV